MKEVKNVGNSFFFVKSSSLQKSTDDSSFRNTFFSVSQQIAMFRLGVLWECQDVTWKTLQEHWRCRSPGNGYQFLLSFHLFTVKGRCLQAIQALRMSLITSAVGYMTSRYWRFIILDSETEIPFISHGFRRQPLQKWTQVFKSEQLA